MNEIEKAIKELTDIVSLTYPLTIEEPAPREAAQQIFTQLNQKEIYPDPKLIYDLLIENNWKKNQANLLVKKFKKHFRSDAWEHEFE